jgi:hypothetical protein
MLAFLLVVVGCLATASTAFAAPVTAVSTVLSVESVAPIRLGARPELSATLTTAAGDPLPDRPIKLFLNGLHISDQHTDQQGIAHFEIKSRLAAGTYDVSVVFNGSQKFSPATATTQMTIQQFQIEISTVPALLGVQFKLDGEVFTSNNDGIAVIGVNQTGKHRLEILPYATETTRAEFDRWSDEVFVATRDVTVPTTDKLQVGLRVSYQVHIVYSDPTGQIVDSQRITSATVRGSAGGVASIAGTEPVWLRANSITRREQGLKSSPILHALQNVIVDGQNVVNQGDQRFFPNPGDTWNVSLLLFSIRISIKDALLHRPLGAGVEIVHPDGRAQTLPLQEGDELTLHSLVRGDYHLRGIGPGYSSITPLALSRDQDIEMLVISYFDMAALLSLGLVAMLSLLLFGRPRLIPSRLRQARQFGRVVIPGWIIALLIVVEYSIPIIAAGYLFSFVRDTPVQARTTVAAMVERIDPENAPALSLTPAATVEPSLPDSPVDISPEFRDFWLRNDGARLLGQPVAPAEEQLDAHSGQTVTIQRFERQTLQYFPAYAGTPYEVQVALLGVDEAVKRDLAETRPFLGDPSRGGVDALCAFFPETGHRLCADFLDYWQANGVDFGDSGTSYRESLALFGFPISEAFVDHRSGVIVQYFERARLEYHAGSDGSPGQVLYVNVQEVQ